MHEGAGRSGATSASMCHVEGEGRLESETELSQSRAHGRARQRRVVGSLSLHLRTSSLSTRLQVLRVKCVNRTTTSRATHGMADYAADRRAPVTQQPNRRCRVPHVYTFLFCASLLRRYAYLSPFSNVTLDESRSFLPSCREVQKRPSGRTCRSNLHISSSAAGPARGGSAVPPSTILWWGDSHTMRHAWAGVTAGVL